MPGPNKKEEKKKIEEAKKAVQGEVKKLAKKTKKMAVQAKELVKEKKEIAKKKKLGPDDKKRAKEVDKKLKVIEKTCKSDAAAASKRINRMLQTYVPDDKDALPAWQKGMDRWYINILNKEPGFDIGGGARVNGQLSIKEKKAVIDFTWKW